MNQILRNIIPATPRLVLFLVTLVIAFSPAMLAFSFVEELSAYKISDKMYEFSVMLYGVLGLVSFPVVTFSVLDRDNWR